MIPPDLQPPPRDWEPIVIDRLEKYRAELEDDLDWQREIQPNCFCPLEDVIQQECVNLADLLCEMSDKELREWWFSGRLPGAAKLQEKT